MKDDFIAWIKNHQNDEYQVEQVDQDVIQLNSDYGKSTIRFTDIEESTVVEFTIVSNKDETVKFYLHFELKDEGHAKQLYDEMVETLVALKNHKTIEVLLSCSAGLTTSMFAQMLNETAQSLHLDYHFNAVSYLNIYEEIEKYDAVMIAPQIGYMLKKLQDTLPDKLVLQIPTALFAAYDAFQTIQFIQDELTNFNKLRKKQKEERCVHCMQHKKRILSIAILRNQTQTRIYYRLYDKSKIIDENLIIKQIRYVYDLYDIIDTILLKHQYIDLIGIASPGIVSDDKQLKDPTTEKYIDMKQDFEEKYHTPVFVYNNANAAAVGFSLEHQEYKNIIFHSQPFGFGVGGQGIIANGRIITGKNGLAGEVKYFLERMQLSDDCHKLILNEQGAIEVVTKALLPAIALVGPDAVAIRSPMTPDMNEIKCHLASFIPKEFLPEFFYIKEVSSYMLDGLTKLCLDCIGEK